MEFLLGGLALFVSLGALMLAADAQRKVSNKNTEMLQSYIKPLKDALVADRKENDQLRKQVTTDREMIDALNEKMKVLEDTLKSLASATKPARAAKPAAQSQANGTNG